ERLGDGAVKTIEHRRRTVDGGGGAIVHRPSSIVLRLVLCLLALGGGVGVSPAAARGGEHHAGLVVQFADGTVQKYCLAFAADSISGFDLLLETGLDVKIEAYGGL